MYDAVVLAGGTARRLHGADKPGLVVGGIPMLDRVLLATVGAMRTVVVGPPRDTVRPVVWTREDPPGGGPVAALAAGLAQVTADRVLVLAADLPFLDQDTVAALTAALPADLDGAVLVDGSQPQWLGGAWRTDVLRLALRGVVVEGARMRDVLGPLRALRVGSQRSPAPWSDVDTEGDLASARARA